LLGIFAGFGGGFGGNTGDGLEPFLLNMFDANWSVICLAPATGKRCGEVVANCCIGTVGDAGNVDRPPWLGNNGFSFDGSATYWEGATSSDFLRRPANARFSLAPAAAEAIPLDCAWDGGVTGGWLAD
jgi:hypothetical protein